MRTSPSSHSFSYPASPLMASIVRWVQHQKKVKALPLLALQALVFGGDRVDRVEERVVDDGVDGALRTRRKAPANGSGPHSQETTAPACRRPCTAPSAS
jgi:hypothetical protein